MALQGAEVEHVDERIEKGSRAVAESHIENALPFARLHRIDSRAHRTALHAAADMVRHHNTGVLGGIPEDVPGFQIHFESHIINQKIRFTKTQLGDSYDLVARRL